MRCREKGNWRRERDSNPRRAFDPYTLSRGAPSTTRPSLRRPINLSRQAGAVSTYHIGGKDDVERTGGFGGPVARRAAEVGYWATAAARHYVRKIVRTQRPSADA